MPTESLPEQAVFAFPVFGMLNATWMLATAFVFCLFAFPGGNTELTVIATEPLTF